ncbi:MULTISPECIES: ribosome recycling factor [unclassified Dietzia]|uniref:ribosome recycling factor n=1 Tax=unclassified Dietzia TaxID=2617939 RepID=UPI000D2159A8|nr:MULTISPECIES: ribosome recycling factor [unclassified Dietzia]AVZ39599.1 ribosome recycling factor [Dietzia sp. JS16-p6b]MBB1022824.1 ribosome recycling factor [Dietzia sp. DQ12-76]MBB1029148.1 ribosome recycling factor [Dietzia sp. DQ11-38-2]QGW24902.1 ribosome recycling factor [Dietzia sp. DQ12-45-1b]
MIDDTLLEAEEKMEKAVERVRDELAAIRTGRANPGMFNRVLCEYYGTLTPITQMASVSVPEPRMLIIKPYEMSQIGPIENAIRNSDLGVNPTNDGQVLRVTVPQLTEERRRDLVRQAKAKAEDGRIAVRGVRRKAMDELKRIVKDGEAGEDEVNAAEKELDKLTHRFVADVDELVKGKEGDLMEV